VLDLYLHRSLRGELELEEALKRAGEEWDRISERTGYEKGLEIWKESGRISIGRIRFLPY